ncbi:CGNR zinc finger domain-containing protein [Mycobacterium montefiorense]|uniref:CGNR zinc finger domain-containing protein n=1 Tax=Mycobacterium montefiorense TaxID=154654 RepID=UPI0021F2DF8C|nr:ABATE domain-containing protein [Mycobacterium montefiorense]MCV7427876.1 CGNR zinc finger domain-containing protein [Mycobacterium montefiorense]
MLAFANTHDHRGRLPDRFSDVAGLQVWLTAQQSSADGAAVVTPADVIEAREIRDALVTVLLTHADAGDATEAELVATEHALRRVAHRYPLEANITRDGAGLVSTQPGLAGVLGTILAAVVELSQSGAWDRLKACRNCHHAFADQSRNWSATFCRAQCRSQAGMRAYRSRHRSPGDA